MRFKYALLFALSVVCCLHAAAQTSPSKSTLKKIDRFLQDQQVKWNIPGVAVTIVSADEVYLSNGYGVKSVDTMEPVNDQSLFAVASNTKAFTAAAIGILVDEGKMSWDDRVRDHLPYFELYDPYVSANMTVRDLLCHRSGLATFSGDLIWYGSNYSREEVIRRAKYLSPKYDFRAHYGYQNIMFIAAGEIVAKVSGKSWDEFVDERFFTPLGMNNSNTSVSDFTTESNVTQPHNEKDGKNHTIDWVNWDNIGGAGAINSSSSEMGKWLQLQLNRGMWGDSTIFSAAASREMWTGHTPKKVSTWSAEMLPSKTMNAYALGWDVFDYQGTRVVTHGGGYDGMISQTVILPEENLAFVILTNNINYLPFVLTYDLIDQLLSVDTPSKINETLYAYKLEDEKNSAQAEAEKQASRIPDTTPSLPLEKYAGTYGGPMYGNCEVRVIGDQLAFQFEPTPLFRGTMRHWHFDTFELNWGTKMMLPSGTVQFIVGTDGEVEEMKIVVENPDFDFSELEFKKLP